MEVTDDGVEVEDVLAGGDQLASSGLIGIGGEIPTNALGNPASDKMRAYFFDNTDPDGMDPSSPAILFRRVSLMRANASSCSTGKRATKATAIMSTAEVGATKDLWHEIVLPCTQMRSGQRTSWGVIVRNLHSLCDRRSSFHPN